MMQLPRPKASMLRYWTSPAMIAAAARSLGFAADAMGGFEFPRLAAPSQEVPHLHVHICGQAVGGGCSKRVNKS